MHIHSERGTGAGRRATTLAATCLLAMLAPVRAADAADPAQAYDASYEMSLAAELPQIQKFGGALGISFDRACNGWRTKTSMDLEIEANGQDLKILVSEVKLERHDGAGMRFEATVTRNGETIVRNKGRVRRKPDGTHALLLETPRKEDRALSAGLRTPVASAFKLLDALARGKVPAPHETFLTASLGMARTEYILVKAVDRMPPPRHSGDPMTQGPAWVVTESITPLDGPNANKTSQQQYLIGEDGVAVEMRLDISGLPGRLKLENFKRKKPSCPAN